MDPVVMMNRDAQSGTTVKVMCVLRTGVTIKFLSKKTGNWNSAVLAGRVNEHGTIHS